jgi:hypothetical protein
MKGLRLGRETSLGKGLDSVLTSRYMVESRVCSNRRE